MNHMILMMQQRAVLDLITAGRASETPCNEAVCLVVQPYETTVDVSATPQHGIAGSVGSIAFELIDEALKQAAVARVGLFTLIGTATFTLGDWVLDRKGGGDRKDAEGA